MVAALHSVVEEECSAAKRDRAEYQRYWRQTHGTRNAPGRAPAEILKAVSEGRSFWGEWVKSKGDWAK
eukprot:5116193-Alexandrium_andersonii.AAC.1